MGFRHQFLTGRARNLRLPRILTRSRAPLPDDPRVREGLFAVMLACYRGYGRITLSRLREDRFEQADFTVEAGDTIRKVVKRAGRTAWRPAEGPGEYLIAHQGLATLPEGVRLALSVDAQGAQTLQWQILRAAEADDICEAELFLSQLLHLRDTGRDRRRVEALTLLTRDECALLAGEVNDTERHFARFDLLDALADLAARQPDAPALIDARGTRSWRQMQEGVMRLSDHLQASQPAGSVIGAHLERGGDAVIALFACWHAGLTWLPLPPGMPDAVLSHMLRTAGARAVLTESGTGIPEVLRARPVIEMPGAATTPDIPAPTPLRRMVSEDAPAAILFTSGTTGMPNGVTHSRRALMNRFLWWRDTYPFAAGEVPAQRTALSFIPSLTEMVSGVLGGCPLVVIADADSRDPQRLLAMIARHGCTRVSLLPSLLQRVLAAEEDAARKLASLRYLVTAGEKLPAELVRHLAAALPGLDVINDYGCTETNGVLALTCRDTDDGDAYLPVGRPIANCRAYILLPSGHHAPVGVAGELYVTGPGVGDGYIGKPELNRARYRRISVPDAEGAATRVPAFKTNDRARWRADGRIEVMGRLDNVLKIRGIRVDLEATETTLNALPGIAEAACCGIAGPHGDTLLAAWIVPTCPDDPPQPAEIRARLREHLAEAAIPARILITGALPRTPNGKLARDRLARLNADDVPTAPAPPDRAVATQKQVTAPARLGPVLDCLGQVLDTDPQTMNPDTGFKLLGLDSASAVDFAALLTETLQRPVAVTMIFDAVTPRALAQRLAGPARTGPRVKTRHGAEADIAVVGLACRMPRAPDIAAFWTLLRDGVDAVGEIPPHRWNWWDYSPDNPAAQAHATSRFGAFLDDEDKFDPGFFNISVREAQAMAPEQRIFLETAWQAFADAGLSEADLRGAAIGVFAGARGSDYAEIRNAAGAETDALGLMGCDNAILAARIAYHLDLKGPVLTIDTACSASLVAVHAACAAIRAGECEQALAGGVSLVNTVTQYLANSRAGMLSPDGRCATFDASANGFVQGEGCGAVVLKPLRQAHADGDRIYAVIKGSAVNQDGRTNGITAPNGDSQRSLLRRAHDMAGVSADAIGMVEAHGTGTRLGDPIEFDALCDVFREAGAAPGGCALGSVKTNIGHLIAAAGIAGFLKACLSLYHRERPGSLHFSQPNPHIALADSPFHVPTQTLPWPKPPEGRRHAAVSAFGFSGTNCHLVLEEATATAPVRDDAAEATVPGPYLFAFSAKTAESLRGYAQRLADWCAARPDQSARDLARMAHALARRVNDFDHAALILAHDVPSLRDALTAIAGGARAPEETVRGEAAPHPAILFCGERRRDMPGEDFRDLAGSLRDALAKGRRQLDDGAGKTLANLFAHGIGIDLPGLTDTGDPISLADLPPYAFTHRRYWADPPVGAASQARETSADGLRLDPADFAGHRVGGRIWLPATAQLVLAAESARAGSGLPARELHLRDWRLTRPVDLTAGGKSAPTLGLDTTSEQLVWRHGHTEVARARRPAPPVGGIPARDAQEAGIDVARLRALMLGLPQQWTMRDFYAHCTASGLDYDGPFRGVRHIGFDEHRLIAVIAPAIGADSCDGFLAQTALLDAACHSLASLTPADARHVPVSAERVDWYATLPRRLICTAQIRSREPAAVIADLRAFDLDGMPVFAIAGLRLAATAAARASLTGGQGISHNDSSDSCEIGSWIQHSRAHHGALRPVIKADPEHPSCRIPDRDGGLIRPGAGPETDGPRDHQQWFWRVPSLARADMIEAFVMHARTVTAHEGDQCLTVEVADRPDDARALAAAARAVQAEHPQFHCRVSAASAPPVAAFRGVREDGIGKGAGGEGETAPFRRLIPPEPSPRRSPPSCLITGGFGGIGRRLCDWLAARHDARIIIASHRAPRAEEEARLAALRERGTEIVVQIGDFTRESDCRALLRRIRLRFGGIDRVYHCAGISADAGIANKTRAQIETVLQAKLDTLEALDAAIAGEALEQMVLFSSISAVIGTPGQCDYAAANAWLDAFAQRRNADPQRHGHTLAINWALWADGRMAPPPSLLDRLWRDHGMAPMPSDPAFERMEALAAAGIGQAVVAWGDLTRLDGWLAAAGDPPRADERASAASGEIAA